MIPRDLGDKVLQLSKGFPVITVTGPRQSGKTTLVRALFPEYTYLNLENLDIRLAAEEDPRRFLGIYAKSGVIIDEAQKVPHLFSYLQEIVDESGKLGKYILTGSQNFLLLEKITQSLAGRVAVCHLLPFTQHEIKNAVFVESKLNAMLFRGGYPVLYDRPVEPVDYFPSYISTYIERDVRSLKNIGDLSTFQRFIKLCAGRTGQILNYSSLGNDAGINYKTVQSWISILEASFVVFLLRPFHKNYGKRVVKQPKLYFFDTGLLCSLLDIQSPEQLENHYLRGGIFESFVVSEYFKSVYHLGLRPSAWFWRNNTGHEIDLLIEKADILSAVEIKSGETINQSFFKGLEYFRTLSNDAKTPYALVYGGNSNQVRKNIKVFSWKSIQSLQSII
jgi:uncharacterized protein